MGVDKMNHWMIIAVVASLVGVSVQVVEAQHSKEIAHIGMLRFDNPNDPRSRGLTEAFRRGLGELGYVEGSNIVIDYRYAEGKLNRLPKLAAELASLKLDLIVTQGTPGTLAMPHAMSTIPIILGGAGNLVVAGLATTLESTASPFPITGAGRSPGIEGNPNGGR
jgi:putative ABC transport system substrate-binding protein